MTSDSVRFSVEVLLYYAPRFDDAGAALSQAGTVAQRRLEGLGSFWGSSWPDESFAESYRPAQHSLLTTAQECASDLRQIASRIHGMAREYGVTEANVTSDINRISQAASEETRLLHSTGGLSPPPDVPEHTPPPLPRTAPTPTPNPPPTPPAPAPPKPPKSHESAPQAPRPSPETAPDSNAWKRRGATSFIGPFPTGKPDLIEQAAEAWRDLATALRTAWEDTQHYAAYVLAENEGHAADHFDAQVRRLVDYNKGSLTLTLQGCEQTERACWDQAQAIRDLKHQFEELAAEFVLTFIIGQLLAAFLAAPTAGGSEVAGQAAEAAEQAGITARAMALLRTFTGAVISRMKTVGTALKDLARVLPKAEQEAAGLSRGSRFADSDLEKAASNAQERGEAYEKYLNSKFNGHPNFKVGGREFDGSYTSDVDGTDVWYEAKSGEALNKITNDPDKLRRFTSNTGQQAALARQAGARFAVVSENPIPEPIRLWLDKKGIPYRVVP